MQVEIGQHQYAAHGGLVIYADKSDGGVTGFHSTLTFGPVRYVFFSRLNAFEKLELKIFHRDFYMWCRERAFAHIETPMTEQELLNAGLKAQESENSDLG